MGGSDGDFTVTLEDVVQASYRLRGLIHRTPLVASRTFSEMSGNEVYMKLENLQRTGAFKIRGATNKVGQLTERERQRGIVTASAGNHAQGVATAASHYGIRSTVVMPETAPLAKVQATEGYGSRVVLAGSHYDDAYAAAMAIAEQEGATFVHAFEDPHVVAGQGTIALEVLEELPNVEAIVVPVGGGGLISGIAIAAKAIHPRIRIIGVQPERANSACLSWAAGERRAIDTPRSMADGLAVRMPGQNTFELMQHHVDELVVVSEQDIEQSMRLYLERAKLLVEGAGAVPLAALLSGVLGLKDQRVALVMSGGNVDLSRLTELARRETVHHANH